MNNHVTFHGRNVRRVAILFAFALSAILAGFSASGSRPAAAAQVTAAAPVTSASNLAATTDSPAGEIVPSDTHGCPFEAFCIWHTYSYSGSPSGVHVQCGTYDINPNNHEGSWVNNQTSGTQVKFLKGDGTVILTSHGAYSQLGDFDWTDIAKVTIC